MKRYAGTFVTGVVLGLSSPVLAAPSFDGSQPLICAAIELQICTTGAKCDAATVDDLDVPEFFRISVQDKKVTGTRPSGIEVDAKIELVRHSASMMLLQGMQEKFGWNIAIGEEDGKMALTISDKENGVVIFGACTPR